MYIHCTHAYMQNSENPIDKTCLDTYSDTFVNEIINTVFINGFFLLVCYNKLGMAHCIHVYRESQVIISK